MRTLIRSENKDEVRVNKRAGVKIQVLVMTTVWVMIYIWVKIQVWVMMCTWVKLWVEFLGQRIKTGFLSKFSHLVLTSSSMSFEGGSIFGLLPPSLFALHPSSDTLSPWNRNRRSAI